VEVISPSDSVAGTVRKARRYIEAGSSVVWVVDPTRRNARVITPANLDGTAVDEHGTLDGGPLFPGLAVPLANVLPPSHGE
jgi:Uma2 family endonuclease